MNNRKMINRKLRTKKEPWTKKEIDALLAGVGKYGQGVDNYGHRQWMNILMDPDFGPILCRRYTVELKHEWRKMARTVTVAMLVSRSKMGAPTAAAAAEDP